MFLHTCGVLMACILTTHARVPMLSPLSGDIEHVTVHHITAGRAIYKRNAEDGCEFPNTLQFQFSVQGKPIDLNLEINTHVSSDVPLYIMGNEQMTKQEINNTHNFALYQDFTRGSAMLVCCQDDGTFTLHGSFWYEGAMYHMSSSGEPMPSSNHYIQRSPPTGNKYLNDTEEPPADELPIARDSIPPKNAGSTDGNIIELVFTADKSLYDYFLAEQGSDSAARTALVQYLALLANEIDLHYCSVYMVDPTVTIRIYLAGVIIPQSGTDLSWSLSSQKSVDGTNYLRSDNILANIKSWTETNAGSLPQNDHIMALSMIDLADTNTTPVYTSVEGKAYVGTMCSSTYKVSIVEVDGSRVSSTAAHELGHALNSSHDGMTGNGANCNADDKNIMTSTVYTTVSNAYAAAQWTFSSCSVTKFKTTINGFSSNCLQEHDFSGVDLATLRDQSLPGTVYSLDQQCQMYNGASSSSCVGTIDENDCYTGLHCSTDNGCTGSYYPLYPLAGTPCGASVDNLWCYRGICTAKPITTSTTSSPTTSTVASTTSTSPSTTICTTSSTTSVTSITTSTSTSSPTTSTSTSSPTTSTSTSSPTTSSCNPNQKCCKKVKVGKKNKKKCCKGTDCCQTTNTWSEGTNCHTGCCLAATVTTPVSTQTTITTFCSAECCTKKGKGKKAKTLCCTGIDCCNVGWGKTLDCCVLCKTTQTTTISTTTGPITTSTTTTQPCFKGKCCGKVKKGKKMKKVCCKGKKCCKQSWAVDSVCCTTCS